MKGHLFERGVILAAVMIFGVMLWGRSGPLVWRQPALYVPAGLVVLSSVNSLLRAKVLSWGIFTVALVVFMIIVGTWVVMDRAMKGPPSLDFLRSAALYGCLAMVGLMQLRLSTPPKGDSSK